MLQGSPSTVTNTHRPRTILCGLLPPGLSKLFCGLIQFSLLQPAQFSQKKKKKKATKHCSLLTSWCSRCKQGWHVNYLHLYPLPFFLGYFFKKPQKTNNPCLSQDELLKSEKRFPPLITGGRIINDIVVIWNVTMNCLPPAFTFSPSPQVWLKQKMGTTGCEKNGQRGDK